MYLNIKLSGPNIINVYNDPTQDILINRSRKVHNLPRTPIIVRGTKSIPGAAFNFKLDDFLQRETKTV